MENLLSKCFRRAARVFNKIADIISGQKIESKKAMLSMEEPVSLQATRVIPWFRDKGDETHRLNYDLDQNSIVFDLGGYEGGWAASIFCKYNCNLFVFEPFKEYVTNIKNRFSNNTKISVYDFGLASNNTSETLYISADSSSLFKPGETAVEIKLVKIEDFLNLHKITNIDLVKINIEGGEYEILEYLVESDKICCFKNIQVQFHDFVPDAFNRMKNIQAKLVKTHALTYQYEFVWENWQLKEK